MNKFNCLATKVGHFHLVSAFARALVLGLGALASSQLGAQTPPVLFDLPSGEKSVMFRLAWENPNNSVVFMTVRYSDYPALSVTSGEVTPGMYLLSPFGDPAWPGAYSIIDGSRREVTIGIPCPPGGAYSVQIDNPESLGNYSVEMILPSGPTVVTHTGDSGVGSLRQAIVIAGCGDLIQFATNVTGTITLTNGPLNIAKDLNILGPGANVLTISGNTTSRVFVVTAGNVNLSGLSIANGIGGISNNAVLSVSNCMVSGHSGNGIYNGGSGTLVLNNCTISGNSKTISSGSFAGAGINNAANTSTLRMTNCTVSGNSISLTGSGSVAGGGITNFGNMVLNSCTVLSNRCLNISGHAEGGGLANGGTLTLINTIVAGNMATNTGGSELGPDCVGAFISGGYNLIGKTNDSSGWTGTEDQTGSAATPLNPLLGPLQNNGGTTLTHALLAGSLAIDKGRSLGVTIDQRGRTRPFDFSAIANPSGGDGSDIGALEYIPSSPQLKVQLVGGTVLLSWPLTDFGFTPESSAALPSPPNTWTPVPGTPAVVADQYYLTDGPPAGIKLYRLKAP